MKNSNQQARKIDANNAGPSRAVRMLIAELRESGEPMSAREVVGAYAIDRYLQNLFTEMAERDIARACDDAERQISFNRRRR